MISIGLAKFAKISQMAPERRAKEYEQYLKGGGYRYYRSFREALRSYAFGNQTKESAGSVISSVKPAAERKNNQQAFDKVAFWLPGKGDPVEISPKEIISPAGQLKVLLRPEFGLKIDGKLRIVTVWNYKSPRIDQKIASIVAAASLYQSAEPPSVDVEYGTLDSHNLEYLAASAVTSTVKAALVAELAFADVILSEALAGGSIAA